MISINYQKALMAILVKKIPI